MKIKPFDYFPFFCDDNLWDLFIAGTNQQAKLVIALIPNVHIQ